MRGMHILNLTDSPHCAGRHAFSSFHTIVNYSLHLKHSVLYCVTIFAHWLRAGFFSFFSALGPRIVFNV